MLRIVTLHPKPPGQGLNRVFSFGYWALGALPLGIRGCVVLFQKFFNASQTEVYDSVWVYMAWDFRKLLSDLRCAARSFTCNL